MDDINRLLIFLLLIGVLYALYRYQDLIFGDSSKKINIQDNPVGNKPIRNNNSTDNTNNRVTTDNISQLSMGSLDDEDGNPAIIYKQDSILGSLDTNSIFQSDDGSLRSEGSNNSSFFF